MLLLLISTLTDGQIPSLFSSLKNVRTIDGKYNPIERCWGVLEQHWNGTLLQDIQTLLGWAQSMTWKGIHPKVWLNSKTYKKGISLSKQEMRDVEDGLERNPELPKWDIVIQPANR